MKKILVFTFLTCALSFATQVFAQKTKVAKKSKSDVLVILTTQFGDIKLRLYEATPKHRENFLKLVKEGFYNDLLFHRVIKDFMIQGGDPNSKNAKPEQMLGSGGPDYKVDAEFKTELYHRKGALAAARDGNPQKASSSCQFYIVQGKKATEEELAGFEKRNNLKYTDKQKEIYKTIGGTPFLDNNYTVFGEVVSGIELVDKIATQETGKADRPKQDIKMSMKIEKISKKKMTKMYGVVYE